MSESKIWYNFNKIVDVIDQINIFIHYVWYLEKFCSLCFGYNGLLQFFMGLHFPAFFCLDKKELNLKTPFKKLRK